MLGYSRDELQQLRLPDVLAEHERPRLDVEVPVMMEGIPHLAEWEHLRKDGSTFLAEINARTLSDGQYLAIVRDLTQRKEAEARIQWLAHFDALTGLANRTLLNDRANHALGMAQRNGGPLALICLDLDHFKHVNDTLGQRVGDAFLVEMGRRIQATVRDVDTVSRQGGDDFILVLPDTDAEGALHVVEKLLVAVGRPFQLDGHELVVTPSIGIAMFPGDGGDFESLAKNADVAMYRAKHAGRNTYRFFKEEMQARSARVLQLENGLRRAQERGELRLHYQPQLSMDGRRVIGAEALLRWQNSSLGTVSPAEFIPVAEHSGQIVQIGEWVLRTAVRQMKAWLDNGLPPMVIAVNLSAVQFRYPDLPRLVTAILDEAGLPPGCLELELTEAVAMDDPVEAIKVMDDLHGRGIRMSIDDFGTGYSSLNHLKRFNVCKLKIDQSFVRDIAEDSEDRAIVNAIITLAKSLGLQTIAEGVETMGQLALLRESGCDEVQGYFFSKPLPADQFEAFALGRNPG
jgi:diguanylate cyclase (GGDEF)-like protein